ncbi:MAG TPA: iron-containing alcohol dehydrogenase [Clostridia bacterium]|nr:iron-containing alcohol dehydrogenase [Clostridia bacterium]
MEKSIFEMSRQNAFEIAENEVAAELDNEVDSLLNSDVVCREIDGVSVMVGKDMAKKIPHFVSEFSLCPQVAILYIDDIAHIARELVILMNNSGFRVFEMSLPKNKSITEQYKMLDDIPDFVRFTLGVGSGRICELCALYSKRQNLDFALFATAPSSDCYLSYEKTPKFVAADEEILNNCPKQLIAAGTGIVLSQPLKEFERKVEGLLFETTFGDEIKKKPKIFTKSIILEGEIVDAVELFWKLAEISKQNKRQSFVSSAEILADVIARANGSRVLGEYVFMASYLLAGYYFCFLSSDCQDVLLPPDKVKTMKLLEKKCGFDYFSLVKRIDILSINKYFRIKYIINEYRKDLLSSLCDLDFKSAQKFWRRQYSDAGYWLSKTFSAKELLTLLSLSGELAGGILGFAKASGALENYI